MGQIVLEGDTLGRRHQYYNDLVKKKIEDNELFDLTDINIEDNDIDNLFKIDVACNTRNVKYIIEVLKSEDMLYVSRAIKHSTWLITDPQYAEIINPQYLHSDLLPQMTIKACNILLLTIRLNLKDESRVDAFFNYYKNKNPTQAQKWLPNCSLALIEQELDNQENRFEIKLIKRLCERSISVLEKYLKRCEYNKMEILKATMFLLNDHTEKYLDIIEPLQRYERPAFGPKATEIIMKKFPNRIIDNFENFCYSKIHLPTCAKYMKHTEIKAFLLKYLTNESMRNWFRFDNVMHFVRYMPNEGRFEFLKKLFIDKSEISAGESDETGPLSDDVDNTLRGAPFYNITSSNVHIYRWYRFAPFGLAFTDLKKLIRNESSPNERYAMLAVLLICARRNLEHMHTLLQYYHDKHINEPFKFKIKFINMVLELTNTHTYDDTLWSILNNIFYSMEVYTESNNNVQSCIQSIIVYKLLHYEKVPEIIEKKFTFDTLKSVLHKLNKEEKIIVFNYLYNILITKTKNKNLENEIEFAEAVQLLESILTLLIDWKKELLDYPWVITEITKMNSIKKQKSFKTDLSPIYNKNKSWRKHMFEDSITMVPSEIVCINALKHDSTLLTRYQNQIEELRNDDSVNLVRLLHKLRTYWSESLANEWVISYLNRLNDPSGHKALVRGICVLLKQKRLIDIVKEYAPIDSKINWSEDDERLLSLRKLIAKNMYLARPLPPPEIVLLYSHGDYLQFALPSLNAILYNMSVVRSREHIPKFLNAPVSLRKHGIRLAFSKLESKELNQIFSNIWKSNKNSTIRAVLFKQTFKILCEEKNPTILQEIWELLNTFFDYLSQEEDRVIYTTLGKLKLIPNITIRAQVCMKGYKYLRSLPAKANCESILSDIANHMPEIMEHLDIDFVAGVLLESFEKNFTTNRYGRNNILVSYLLCAKDTMSQTERYQKVLAPFWDKFFPLWTVKVDGSHVVRHNIVELLKELNSNLTEYALARKMVFPIKLFKDILIKLEENLPIHSNYVIIKTWSLLVNYVTHLEKYQELSASIEISPTSRRERCGYPQYDKTWNVIHMKVLPNFVSDCVENLKKEMKSYFPSIYVLFGASLEKMFGDMQIDNLIFMETLKEMLKYEDFIECYIMVINILPQYFYEEPYENLVKEIKKILVSHPSDEVKAHYYLVFKTYDQDEENK